MWKLYHRFALLTHCASACVGTFCTAILFVVLVLQVNAQKFFLHELVFLFYHVYSGNETLLCIDCDSRWGFDGRDMRLLWVVFTLQLRELLLNPRY